MSAPTPPEQRQVADYVATVRRAADRPCARESFERLGMQSHCMHCWAVRKLRLIDGQADA